MTNRSFAPTIRTSAGIMSPAASLTTSPGTRWDTGSSWGWPSRNTAAVTEIMALSFAAVASARRSCVSRRPTPSTIISDITMPARASPVENEIVGEHGEQQHERVDDRVPDEQAEALASVDGDDVRATFGQPRLGLVRGETGRTAVQPLIDVLDGERRGLEQQRGDANGRRLPPERGEDALGQADGCDSLRRPHDAIG